MLSVLTRRISAAINKIPSHILAFAYLGCIPLFALIYTALPSRSFYHSNIKLEPSFQHDTGILRKALGDAISENVLRVMHTYRVTASSQKFDLSSLTCDELHVEDNRVVISFSSGPTQYPCMPVSYEVSLIATDQETNFDKNRYTYLIVQRRQDIRASDRDLFEAIFPLCAAGTWGHSGRESTGFLPINKELDSEIAGYIDANSGFPNLTGTNALGRMLYFSAITITTVGLGDIVPISSPARLLVGVEAVLGIVLIGLFLNALAREHRDV